MTDEQLLFNEFFIDVFNHILRSEERALTKMTGGVLSLKEIHVIEAVCQAQPGNANTMGELSDALRVTMGTLTVSVNTLVKKGYLTRHRDEADKRTVRILPTPKALETNQQHTAYHLAMVESLTGQLDEHQLQSLTEALKILKDFFLS